MSAENKSRRIHELDLLRGFFICVIILDHLQFLGLVLFST